MSSARKKRRRGVARTVRERGRAAHLLAVLARHLVMLYPRAWRCRYESEVVDLLAATPITLRLLGDLLLGMLDAHLWPQFGERALGQWARVAVAAAVLVAVVVMGGLMNTGTVLRAGASLTDQLHPAAATAESRLIDREPQAPLTVQKAES